MAGTGAGYDLSVTTFSPDGRVFQVEYAQKAIENSTTAIAICCKDGIIFGCEKVMVSKMLVQGTNRRTFPVHRRAGIVAAGLNADARQLVSRAQGEAKSYLSSYAEEIPPQVLAERLGMFMHAYTLYGSIRPFGCAALLGCVDQDTKETALFCCDPSGLVYKYRGAAIGKGKMAANTELEKLLANEERTCATALVEVARVLHKIHDEKGGDYELELSWICPASKYEMSLVPENLKKEAEAEAKRRIEAEEEE